MDATLGQTLDDRVGHAVCLHQSRSRASSRHLNPEQGKYRRQRFPFVHQSFTCRLESVPVSHRRCRIIVLNHSAPLDAGTVAQCRSAMSAIRSRSAMTAPGMSWAHLGVRDAGPVARPALPVGFLGCRHYISGDLLGGHGRSRLVPGSGMERLFMISGALFGRASRLWFVAAKCACDVLITGGADDHVNLADRISAAGHHARRLTSCAAQSRADWRMPGDMSRFRCRCSQVQTILLPSRIAPR